MAAYIADGAALLNRSAHLLMRLSRSIGQGCAGRNTAFKFCGFSAASIFRICRDRSKAAHWVGGCPLQLVHKRAEQLAAKFPDCAHRVLRDLVQILEHAARDSTGCSQFLGHHTRRTVLLILYLEQFCRPNLPSAGHPSKWDKALAAILSRSHQPDVQVDGAPRDIIHCIRARLSQRVPKLYWMQPVRCTDLGSNLL